MGVPADRGGLAPSCYTSKTREPTSPRSPDHLRASPIARLTPSLYPCIDVPVLTYSVVLINGKVWPKFPLSYQV